MRKKLATRVISVAAAAIMAFSMTACSSSSSSSSSSDDTASEETEEAASEETEETEEAEETTVSTGETVTISMYTTIPGHDSDFEDIIADFMADNPDVVVNYIAYDSSEKQKWMTLYASGEAPTVSVMDAVDILENQENMLAFSADDDVLDGIDATYVDVFLGDDGEIYGVPDSVQAMGIMYNKTVIEEATGEEFDPSSITCLSDLRELCEKIEAGGVAPLMLTGVDWSLGSHFLSQVFDGIQGDAEDQEAFIEAVKSGEVDLKTNDAWNSVMDTFDLFAEYNYNSADPLVGNTDIDGQAMANGEVAMWFMGDWGWSYISELYNGEDEYGLMAVPLTDDPDDEINQQLGVFPAKGFCIDASQSTVEQQEAGKRLIEYIMKTDSQKFADLLETALPYSDVEVEYTSPMITSVQDYVASGSTYSTYAFSALLPSDFWSENGATMQQYLAGAIDRDTAADQIQAYWQSQD